MKRRRLNIKKAIKRPGALTARVGGPPSENLGKVRALAKQKGLAGQQARFYLNALRPINEKQSDGKKKKKKRRRVSK